MIEQQFRYEDSRKTYISQRCYRVGSYNSCYLEYESSSLACSPLQYVLFFLARSLHAVIVGLPSDLIPVVSVLLTGYALCV